MCIVDFRALERVEFLIMQTMDDWSMIGEKLILKKWAYNDMNYEIVQFLLFFFFSFLIFIKNISFVAINFVFWEDVCLIKWVSDIW